MPITSTTNALATITSVTNILPTITNGTNIYLQQQITTTDLSTVSISNLITETTTITSWSDPALWSAVAAILSVVIITCQAILSRSSIKHMEKQNKISADSVIEMKRQYEQKEERDQYREDKKELREFIEKYLMSELDKVRLYKKTVNTPVPEDKLDDFIFYSHKSLIRLVNTSEGLFYKNSLNSILKKVNTYSNIIRDPRRYLLVVKQSLMGVISTINENLYSALTNKDSYDSLIVQMNLFINTLERDLTDNERKQLEEARIEKKKKQEILQPYLQQQKQNNTK